MLKIKYGDPKLLHCLKIKYITKENPVLEIYFLYTTSHNNDDSINKNMIKISNSFFLVCEHLHFLHYIWKNLSDLPTVILVFGNRH